MSWSEFRSAIDPRRGLLAGGLLLLAVMAAYGNTLRAPFLFDDLRSILRNPRLGGDVTAIPPAAQTTLSGRPVASLTFAFNRAVSGDRVWSYHAVNIAIHATAALLLFGLVRRSLEQPPLAGRFGPAALGLGLSTAAIWALHPLQTEAVTYIVQRVESLMGLCYLLTLYAFVRSASASRPWSWQLLSVAACAAGMGTKEVMVSAPLMVWLYDRTFVSGSFRTAWTRRRIYYVALFATWLLLASLVWRTAGRGGTAGFGTEIGAGAYLLTQCGAVMHYLRLVFWPEPLVFDYGVSTVQGFSAVWWQALALSGAGLATVWAVWRRRIWGYPAAWFFVTLAPSSSFVPVASQTMAEHRMYLALAAPVLAVVLAAWSWLGRRTAWIWLGAGLLLAALTARRNVDYRSAESIWADTVAKLPENGRAHQNLAGARVEAGQWEDALGAAREALQRGSDPRGQIRGLIGQALVGLQRPAEALPYVEEAHSRAGSDAEVHNDVGIALAGVGRWSEAAAYYEEALALDPGLAEAHNNLANALVKLQRVPEALAHYEAAVRLRPEMLDARVNWARSLIESGRAAEAVPHLQAVLSARPDAATHLDLGNAFAATGRTREAIVEYEAALRIAPDSAETRLQLGHVQRALGHADLAFTHYEAALRLRPDYPEAHYSLGNLLAAQQRFAEAAASYEAALRLNPGLTAARRNLASAWMQVGRPADAVPFYREVLKQYPDAADVGHELAIALGQLGRWREAEAEELAALKRQPDFPEAREHLRWIRQH